MTGPAPSIPSEIFDSLFVDVQARKLYGDSKSFADAVPRRHPSDILQEWQDKRLLTDTALRNFIDANFELPAQYDHANDGTADFETYLANAWNALTRTQLEAAPYCSALALPRPFVVPGGRFRELYYWDSYFTMLGLDVSGRHDLIEDMIGNFGSLLDRFGMIPNATRSYYLSRSHPPLFYLAAGLSQDQSVACRRRRLAWMRQEHGFWMAGEDMVTPGETHRRVVRLPDGTLLNRYWDDRAQPRDESWIEDFELAANLPDAAKAALWRNLRAAAESGWDFSSRWLADGQSLETISTTRILPIDLNCLLFGLEQTIASEAMALGDQTEAAAFERRALQRSAAIATYLWTEEGGFHADYWLDAGAPSAQITAAAAFPLFTGQCSVDRARRTVDALRNLLAPGGLLTTMSHTGQQWDAPNGWAPLQWVACQGLQRYEEKDLAEEIARRWLALVERHYRASGQIMEKYDVIAETAGGGGEYAVEIGFGWTNGVVLALKRMLDQADTGLTQ
ncbi:MAG: alpha,alpha-trehalase TreF [Sphingomonadaceae bacterium]|nr:alpha,alpha-trehalase TreF [Sphingomonadaceae bacterium]